MPAYRAGSGAASAASRSASPRDRLVIRQRQCDKENHAGVKACRRLSSARCRPTAAFTLLYSQNRTKRGYCRPRIGVYPLHIGRNKGTSTTIATGGKKTHSRFALETAKWGAWASRLGSRADRMYIRSRYICERKPPFQNGETAWRSEFRRRSPKRPASTRETA